MTSKGRSFISRKFNGKHSPTSLQLVEIYDILKWSNTFTHYFINEIISSVNVSWYETVN